MYGERVLPEVEALSCGPGLLLRRHRQRDLVPILEMCQDTEMQRWTTVPVPYLPGDAESYLARLRESWRAGSAAGLAIEFEGRYAGNIDLRMEEGDWAEVGYATAPWARGRGVMSRALVVALDWAFASVELHGAHWRAHAGNEASRRVAARCGFRFEGTARALLVQRGRRVDGWMGSLVPSELARL